MLPGVVYVCGDFNARLESGVRVAKQWRFSWVVMHTIVERASRVFTPPGLLLILGSVHRTSGVWSQWRHCLNSGRAAIDSIESTRLDPEFS
jgi:hypothetical protein